MLATGNTRQEYKGRGKTRSVEEKETRIKIHSFALKKSKDHKDVLSPFRSNEVEEQAPLPTLEFCVVEASDGLDGILSSFHVHKGIIFHDIALKHGAVFLKLGPQLQVRAAGADVAHVQLGGSLALVFAGFDVDADAVQLVVVQVADGVLGGRLVFNVHKPIILDDVTLQDSAVLLEKGADLLLGGFPGKVADEKFHHGGWS
ncbi:hypothetical protein E2320_013807 [Naja naja]|nr:hypothetical protein E2320_013807 [Naja naja]